MYSAVLRCGEVLMFGSRDFLPGGGEMVPCVRHGYCVVAETSRARVSVVRQRAKPRTQYELVEWLQARPVTTIQALRRQRFTLRLLAAAERDGLISVDSEQGSVVMR
jgi:hypothetical protein